MAAAGVTAARSMAQLEDKFEDPEEEEQQQQQQQLPEENGVVAPPSAWSRPAGVEVQQPEGREQ